MTRIVIDGVYGQLCPGGEHRDEIIALVDTATSWKDPGAWWSPAFRRGRWDGIHHLLTKKLLRFPAGLTPRVVRALDSQGYDCVVEDVRRFGDRGSTVVELSGIELHDYQREAVLAGLETPYGIIKMPSGTGKTEVMISLVASLGRFPVIWLTHETYLLNQTYDRFCKRLEGRGISVGRLGDGIDDRGDVTITTVQTMSRRLKEGDGKEFLRSQRVVISDETHHEPAGEWYRVLMKCLAPFRYGCSATPLDRQDGTSLRLIGSVGDILYELTPARAVELGILSLPRMRFVRYKKKKLQRLDGLLGGALTYAEVYDSGVVDSEERNEIILLLVQRAVEEGRRVLILIRRLRHGGMLLRSLIKWFDSSTPVQFLRGEVHSDLRSKVVQAFQSGVVRVIIASSIFDEGVDIPEIDTIIMAAAGKSPIKTMQRVGRGMRRSESEHELEVYDFVDKCHRYLDNHSKLRMKTCEDMGLGSVEVVSLDDILST